MALSAEKRAQLEAWLAEAEAAYHQLQIGTSARVVVDQNGERVEYTSANRSALLAYIQSLKDQLACVSVKSGPMKVWYK